MDDGAEESWPPSPPAYRDAPLPPDGRLSKGGERLGNDLELERDVFDVLLSDGCNKVLTALWFFRALSIPLTAAFDGGTRQMKTLLSPALNDLVWKRELVARSIISVTGFQVFNEDPEDERRQQRVCVLHDLEVSPPSNGENPPEKILHRRYGANKTANQLEFISTVHPREVELIPLAGERLYYLPLHSDHYSLDWACSFTDGIPDHDSPLDELECDWSRRYVDPVAVDHTDDEQPVQRSPTVAWEATPRYCSSLFTEDVKKIHTIQEASAMVKRTKKSSSSLQSYPPMVGVIRVKSKVMHVGDPSVSNPFPFVFNVVFGKCFVNILHTQYWGEGAIEQREILFFDFVGVLSNVGKICFKRKRKSGEDGKDAEATEYRWVKAIDSSSSRELLIKLDECSQPSLFRALEAGNTLMATKLQWVILPGVHGESRIQYAVTSVFSVLRVNDAVLPFRSFEECSLNVYFAKTIKAQEVFEKCTATGESKLAAHIEKKYRPLNPLPTSLDQFLDTFGVDVLSFSGGSVVYLELGDNDNPHQILTVQVVVNPLFQSPAIKGGVKTLTPSESLPLIRVLPPAVVDDLYAEVTRDGTDGDSKDDEGAQAMTTKRPELSLGFIKHYLAKPDNQYFFSIRLYRDAAGHVKWEVDAILTVPSDP
ncbi:hypothetical protein BBJ28_00011337 [Nothophytophthora sp. Chile5]|nr:hypothetical protein BBJ28_00011337 [Nothophytophthora sp. Chile5]